ncbi:MAG: hypothetical protein AAF849_22070 [Bacteroidota bacterium]
MVRREVAYYTVSRLTKVGYRAKLVELTEYVTIRFLPEPALLATARWGASGTMKPLLAQDVLLAATYRVASGQKYRRPRLKE